MESSLVVMVLQDILCRALAAVTGLVGEEIRDKTNWRWMTD